VLINNGRKERVIAEGKRTVSVCLAPAEGEAKEEIYQQGGARPGYR
tara:strand:+ start:784 stop:921 length:138 start_codon:yes stop_codon:yes gene_type:complete